MHSQELLKPDGRKLLLYSRYLIAEGITASKDQSRTPKPHSGRFHYGLSDSFSQKNGFKTPSFKDGFTH